MMLSHLPHFRLQRGKVMMKLDRSAERRCIWRYAIPGRLSGENVG